MNDLSQLALKLDSQDEVAIAEIIAELKDVEVERWRKVRAVDPVVVLSVVATTATLVKTLWDLAEKLRKKPESTSIVVTNENGQTVVLSTASLDEIKNLLES